MTTTDSEAQPNPAHWPHGVHQMTFADVGKLGVDDHHRLYWDGRQVEVRQALTLTFWQRVGSILLVTFTVVGGIGAAAQGWAAAHQWSCQIQLTGWGCPPPSPPPASVLSIFEGLPTK